MSAWSVKALRAPSWHWRYARVSKVLQATAMHDNDYNPRRGPRRTTVPIRNNVSKQATRVVTYSPMKYDMCGQGK